MGGIMSQCLHSHLTDSIIFCFYNVYNALGYGFLEKVYENALLVELRKQGIEAQAQAPISVIYSGEVVGEYFCDLLVDNRVIVEIKAVKRLMAEHEAQLLNYLNATDIEVGLLLNFGSEPQLKRKVFSNTRKVNRSQIDA
jgi:GxxExxY protein